MQSARSAALAQEAVGEAVAACAVSERYIESPRYLLPTHCLSAAERLSLESLPRPSRFWKRLLPHESPVRATLIWGGHVRPQLSTMPRSCLVVSLKAYDFHRVAPCVKDLLLGALPRIVEAKCKRIMKYRIGMAAIQIIYLNFCRRV